MFSALMAHRLPKTLEALGCGNAAGCIESEVRNLTENATVSQLNGTIVEYQACCLIQGGGCLGTAHLFWTLKL